MSYRVVISPVAQKVLDRLPREVQERLSNKILTLAENPRQPGTKILQGAKEFLRLRVGDYRVIYQVEDDRSLVRVIKVGHRREVYRKS